MNKIKKIAGILILIFFVPQGFAESKICEVKVPVQFNQSQSLATLPLQINLLGSIQADTQSCIIQADNVVIDPLSLKVTLKGSQIPACVLPNGNIEIATPVLCGEKAVFSVSYQMSETKPASKSPDLPRSWKFHNDFYGLSFNDQGCPVFTSQFGGKALPLATGQLPMATTLKSIRLIQEDPVGVTVEVVHINPKIQKMVSTYRCYRAMPYCVVNRQIINIGTEAINYTSESNKLYAGACLMDKFAVTPGGRFDWKKDYYSDSNSETRNVLFERTKECLWGSWGGRFVDVSEPGKVGFGLCLFPEESSYKDRFESVSAFDRCVGGQSPQSDNGYICMLFSEVKIPAGKAFAYQFAATFHQKDWTVTREFADAVEVMNVIQMPVSVEKSSLESGKGDLQLSIDSASGVIGVKNDWAEWCFNLKKPAMEWMRVRSHGRHYRWDGVGVDDWTGNLMRISDCSLPLNALGYYPLTPKSIPMPLSANYQPIQSPYTIKWSNGATVRISADGEVQLNDFPTYGEISTLDFTSYQAKSRIEKECLGEDMPVINDRPVIACNPVTGLIMEGDFTVSSLLNDDGLTPSLERLIRIGKWFRVYSRSAGEIPEWAKSNINKSEPAVNVSEKIDDVSVRLITKPAPVIRLWPTHTTGYQGRPIKMGVNPVPVRVDLEFIATKANEVNIHLPSEVNYVAGMSWKSDASPAAEVRLSLDSQKENRVSLWVTLKENTLGKYNLPLLVSIKGHDSVCIKVPITVRLSPVYGTWVYFRYWWEGPPHDRPVTFRDAMEKTSHPVQRDSWERFPEDLVSHRINTIIYQKQFDEYFTTGTLDLSSFDREVSQFQRENLRLVISTDHWGTLMNWNEQKDGPRSSANPKYVKFLEYCYGRLMQRYDHWPHVIGWYNLDEAENKSLVNLTYKTSVKMGITRSVHSLFYLIKNTHKKMMDAMVDLWHCDLYTENLGEIKDWIEFSKSNFSDRAIWLTLSGHERMGKWRYIRQQGIFSYTSGIEGILYWMYLERPETGYALVGSGPHGPITTARWESVRQTGIDLEYLATIDYLLKQISAEQMKSQEFKEILNHRTRAIQAAESLRFHECRKELQMAWNAAVQLYGLSEKLESPETELIEP